jgi:signal transduction histidine kinase
VETAAQNFEAMILGSMSSGVVAIDCQGAIRVLNAAAQQVLGCPRGAAAAALGRDCREVLERQPRVARLLLGALERESPISRGELSLEGEGATIGLTLGPVRGEQGRVCGAGMIFRDLAPIERQDERARLRDRLAALGEMAAGLAHAIRNPLAGMEVNAGLLRRRLAPDSDERELLDELLSELRAVSRSVTQSLEFVRPATPELARVDPVLLLEEACRTARARVAFAGVVECAWPAELPVLEADAEQLRSALTDLVVNALQALAGHGRLRLSVRSEPAAGSVGPPDVVLAIADDGPGVPDALREKVFHPFFTTREEGSGVGLANARKVVLSHGGQLDLTSVPGGGSCFAVRLPSGAAGRA